MVSDVSFSTALNQQQNTAASTESLAEDFSQFLTLLTVQLQNQDPLDPMDTSEFTNQIVAFTGVEQQINTNQKLDSLVALQLGSALSTAQNYVGLDISYVSSEFGFDGQSADLKYSMPTQAKDSKINILNEAGQIVYTAEAQKIPGAHNFTWDGSVNGGGVAPPGTYEIRVEATDILDDPIQTTTVVNGRVRGAESQNGQIFLLVGERAVALSNVLNTSTNDGIDNVSDAMTLALRYIGMDVTYDNDKFVFSGTPQDLTYSLPATSDRTQILIRNDRGQIIDTADVSNAQGSHSFTWDGILPDGSTAPSAEYSFEIDAIGADDQRITATTTAAGTVAGVETLNGQIFLDVAGRVIPLKNILSVSNPQEVPDAA